MVQPTPALAGRARPPLLYCGTMSVSLIALDLDDTLLSPNLRISQANKEAIRLAMDSGLAVVLASGRHYSSMRPYAQELGLADRPWPMVCLNGAEVRNVGNGEVLLRLELSTDACQTILAVLARRGLPAQAYEEDYILVSERNRWTAEDSRLTGMPNRLAAPGELAIKPRTKFVVAAEPEIIGRQAPEVAQELAGLARVIVSKPYFMELLPSEADKANALAWIAERVGLDRDRVMAIGDSGNDLQMVAWAGYGCAPSDARADVLARARFVSTLPHDRDAVAELIHRVALA